MADSPPVEEEDIDGPGDQLQWGVDPGAARMPSDYQLATVVKAKKSRADTGKAVALISATYDPSGHTVTLAPRGKVPASPLQLTIIAVKTLDAEGRPLDGDHDGQPGGNFQTTLRKAVTRAALAPPIGLAGRVINALLDGGHADTISLLPYGQRRNSTPGSHAFHSFPVPTSNSTSVHISHTLRSQGTPFLQAKYIARSKD